MMKKVFFGLALFGCVPVVLGSSLPEQLTMETNQQRIQDILETTRSKIVHLNEQLNTMCSGSAESLSPAKAQELIKESLKAMKKYEEQLIAAQQEAQCSLSPESLATANTRRKNVTNMSSEISSTYDIDEKERQFYEQIENFILNEIIAAEKRKESTATVTSPAAGSAAEAAPIAAETAVDEKAARKAESAARDAIVSFCANFDTSFYMRGYSSLSYEKWRDQILSLESGIDFLLKKKLIEKLESQTTKKTSKTVDEKDKLLIDEIGHIIIILADSKVFDNLCDVLTKVPATESIETEERVSDTLAHLCYLCYFAAKELGSNYTFYQPFSETLAMNLMRFGNNIIDNLQEIKMRKDLMKSMGENPRGFYFNPFLEFAHIVGDYFAQRSEYHP